MQVVSPLLLRAGLRYQLRHRWQTLLALTGIVMGVAVVLAVDLANGAAEASFALSSRQLQGAATHRVVGAGGEVPDELYARLATTPGHPPIAPVISARVRIAGHKGRLQLIGLDLFAEGPFRERLPGLIQGEASVGEWLSRPDAAALSASAAEALGVAPGSALALTYQGRPYPLQVLAVSDDTSLASRNLIVVDIATAQAITGLQGGLSHIDVILDEHSRPWLEERLPGSTRLLDIAQQNRNSAGLSAAFELNLTAMSLLALMVGMFLIFNAISFSIVQRRNLIGRLRALGVRREELARLVLIEALMLGIVGTVLGTLAGVWLGQGLTQIVAATVSELYYEVTADAMTLSWRSLIKAWTLGLGGTLVAAWLPARQAAATPALTTLSRAALEETARNQLPWLAALGALLIFTGFLVVRILPGGVVPGFAGLFILLLGAALVTPFALQLAYRLLTRIPLRGIWQIAVRDLDRHLSRLSTAAAALMVALAASVGVAVMVDSMRGAVSDWLQDVLSADLYIAAEGFEDGATLPDRVAAQAPLLWQVGAYSSYRKRELQTDDNRIILVAAQLAAPSRAGFQFIATGSIDPWVEFELGELLISEPLAHRLDLSPGDTLTLPTAGGELAFRIAAVFRDFASEHGRVFIDQRHYRDHWHDQHTDTLALFAENGDALALLGAASDRFSGEYELVFTAAREIYDESMAVFERTFRITEVLRLLSVMVAFIGVLSALMALQLERRKEYAVMRTLGLTRAQVSGLIVIESVVLGLLAALLALPTGLALAWVLTAAIQLRAFGWSMPFLVGASPLIWTVFTGLSAAFLASLYPAWRSARHNPAPQLRED
ncbi:MAG: FtsX-like permease family protein [Sedimenticolaceae bacterium]